jgi:hypothetical protein
MYIWQGVCQRNILKLRHDKRNMFRLVVISDIGERNKFRQAEDGTRKGVTETGPES